MDNWISLNSTCYGPIPQFCKNPCLRTKVVRPTVNEVVRSIDSAAQTAFSKLLELRAEKATSLVSLSATNPWRFVS
jgi:Zn-dependent oligopeptidase